MTDRDDVSVLRRLKLWVAILELALFFVSVLLQAPAGSGPGCFASIACICPIPRAQSEVGRLVQCTRPSRGDPSPLLIIINLNSASGSKSSLSLSLSLCAVRNLPKINPANLIYRAYVARRGQWESDRGARRFIYKSRSESFLAKLENSARG